ncbi:hypothetical protein R1sor_024250 [Riccia sorocarpa]|uniref:DEUBAD domain-containing protein n=1 Tax=Riccia sorocarpa TaxID=122646 RepID=A0ABD3GTZ0_9MARC
MGNEEEILRRCSSRRPHAILAWDDAAKKIVAPATLVGMTWNHTSSSSIPSKFGLVDNFIAPKELLELADLDKVLTMEVWASWLTASEKKFLSSYLPDGVDRETAVRALLNGDNLHFGNPRHTWGVSVCSGAMHPDNLVKRENAVRKTCLSQKKHLRIYHSKMVDVLQKMKDIWRECESNGEVLPRIYRWLKSTGRGSIPASANGLIPPKRISENDEKRAKSELAKEKPKGHKTTRKDRSIEGQDSHTAKRLKTESGAGDRFVDKQEGEFPDSEFFQKYVKVSVGALSREQLSDITLPVKVTRRQFENVKLRCDAGEEVDFDSLQPEQDRENASDRDRKKKEVDKKDIEKLKRYWCEQVVRSLPGAHTRFLERKARLLELADSIARSCKEERAYLMPQYEERCSPEMVAQTKDEFRVPVEASDSGADEETFSRNSGGSDKHLLAGTASSEEIEEEFSMQSPREKEAVDLDSAGNQLQTHLPHQRHALWPSESAPPKSVPQLWGNMNWRPS